MIEGLAKGYRTAGERREMFVWKGQKSGNVFWLAVNRGKFREPILGHSALLLTPVGSPP